MTPVEPLKKAMGRNTAVSTRAMPTSAPVISAHRLAGRLLGGQLVLVHHALDVLHDDDGIVHQQADRQHHAEHGQRVDRVAGGGRMPKVPSSTTGTAIVGIRVARKFCRNRYITRNTSTIASNSVFTTSSMETRTNGVVS